MLSNNDGCAVARSNEVKALGGKDGCALVPTIGAGKAARHCCALFQLCTLCGHVQPRGVNPARLQSQRGSVFHRRKFSRFKWLGQPVAIFHQHGAIHAPAYVAVDRPAGVRGHRPIENAGQARQPHRQEKSPLQWRVRSCIHATSRNRYAAGRHRGWRSMGRWPSHRGALAGSRNPDGEGICAMRLRPGCAHASAW